MFPKKYFQNASPPTLHPQNISGRFIGIKGNQVIFFLSLLQNTVYETQISDYIRTLPYEKKIKTVQSNQKEQTDEEKGLLRKVMLHPAACK